jgi:hypothetical protein
MSAMSFAHPGTNDRAPRTVLGWIVVATLACRPGIIQDQPSLRPSADFCCERLQDDLPFGGYDVVWVADDNPGDLRLRRQCTSAVVGEDYAQAGRLRACPYQWACC